LSFLVFCLFSVSSFSDTYRRIACHCPDSLLDTIWPSFSVSRYEHSFISLDKWPTWCTISLYNTFIITIPYIFRATLCTSSGGQTVLLQHLV
jgi:hypothetical protein